jgi:hypothetical protein
MAACQEVMEADPDEMRFVHVEVFKEEAGVKSSGALKKWLGDQHLAVRRHRVPKEWIWEIVDPTEG